MTDFTTAPEKSLAEWRKANRWASEAEEAVFLASVAYARGRGPLPAETTRQGAKDLRQRASALLEGSLAELQVSRPAYGSSHAGPSWDGAQEHSQRAR
jgi:hypothetical protein